MEREKRRTRLLIVAALGLLASPLGAAPSGPGADSNGSLESLVPPSDRPDEPLLQNWPARSRALVLAMTEKYGQPNRINGFEAIWYNNGPWRRSIVHRNSWSPFIGVRDNDCLEQTISYSIKEDKLWDLRRFGKRIEIDENAGEVTSRAESESLNFLALNLVEDIAEGKRSVKSARDYYVKAQDLAKSGKTSPYLEGFGYWVDGEKVSPSNLPVVPRAPGSEEFH